MFSKGWDAIMGFDLFILAILVITTIRGAAKGVAWQLAGIAALVLCFLFATPLSLTVAPMIKLDAPLNRWVAMLGIYLVFSFFTFAVARGFKGALEKAKFVEYDRHLGALFGLAKGAIIALVITFFCVAMSKQAREIILKTKTGYAAAHIMNAIDPIMPKELHAILEPYIHQLDEVDPALAAEREKHHHELQQHSDTGANVKRPSRGYRSTGPNDDPFESEDERAAPRDPFQDGQSEFDANETGASANQPRLTEPDEVAPELGDPSNSALNFDWLKDLPHLASKAIKKQLFSAFENTAAEHRDEFIQTLKKAPPDAAHVVVREWQNGRPQRAPRSPIQPTGDEEHFDLPAVPRVIKRPNTSKVPPLPFETDPTLEPASDPYTLDTDPSPPIRIRQPGESRPVDDPVLENHPQENYPRENRPLINRAQGQPPAPRQQLLLGIAKVFSSRRTEQAQKMTEIETSMLGLPDQVIDGTLDDWLADLRGVDPDPDPHTDLSTALNVRIARQVESNNIPHTQLPPEWQSKLERFFKNAR